MEGIHYCTYNFYQMSKIRNIYDKDFKMKNYLKNISIVFLLGITFQDPLLATDFCHQRISQIFKKSSVMDVSRTEKSLMYISTPQSKRDIINTILIARMRRLNVTVLGTNHTHGGHNRKSDINGLPSAVQIDMSKMNKILGMDISKKLVAVEPGVTWKELAIYLNKFGLAARTEQSSNIFSIGGSVATNVHGRDVYGPLINSIESIKYIDGNGFEHFVSRSRNHQLFRAIVGGYGGFGVMTEVVLRVEKNFIYEAHSTLDIPVDQYKDYLIKFGKRAKHEMHYGRVNISGENAFEKVSFVEWRPVSSEVTDRMNEAIFQMKSEEKNRFASSMIMNTMRFKPSSNAGKKIKDYLDKMFGLPKTGMRMSKNNILNNPVQFLFDNFYNKSQSVDILQEYFLPVEAMDLFFKKIKQVNVDYDLNLLNVTMRFIPKIERVDDSLLTPYSAKHDQVAIVLYYNISEINGKNNGDLVDYNGSAWTQELIREAQLRGGTFYLPYHRWWSEDQIQTQSANEIKEYFKLKDQYDSKNMFESDFLKELRKTNH